MCHKGLPSPVTYLNIWQSVCVRSETFFQGDWGMAEMWGTGSKLFWRPFTNIRDLKLKEILTSHIYLSQDKVGAITFFVQGMTLVDQKKHNSWAGQLIHICDTDIVNKSRNKRKVHFSAVWKQYD